MARRRGLGMAGWRLMRLWVGDCDDGELYDEDEARVSVLDHGFTVADGVFETLKVTREGAFALDCDVRPRLPIKIY